MATIAISAGHNYGTGARARDGTDEHTFNTVIINHLKELLRCQGHTVHVLHRKKFLGYTAAMRDLARQMRDLGSDLALELHFNSSSTEANGFEYLHWLGSKKGKLLAQCLGQSQAAFTPDIRSRGDKGARSLWYHSWNDGKAYSNRGGAYVYLTPCPAVICEPGFASNESDFRVMKQCPQDLAHSYATGIRLYLKSIS